MPKVGMTLDLLNLKGFIGPELVGSGFSVLG
jgi:hypothetical protein